VSDSTATLESLGKKIGVSKERVRQIEERTRTKLRDRLKALGWDNLLAS
jgi:RNA polymerase sigma-32 factor